jgi:hypothetical protein
MRKNAAFRCASLVKSMAWSLKKRISSNHSDRWNKGRRRHWILKYFSPQEFLNDRNAGATELFFGYFKTFLIVAFPPPQKNLDFPEPHF